MPQTDYKKITQKTPRSTYMYDFQDVSLAEELCAPRGFYSEGLFTDIDLLWPGPALPQGGTLCTQLILHVMFTADMRERTNSLSGMYERVREREMKGSSWFDYACLSNSYWMPHCHLQAISIDPPRAPASSVFCVLWCKQ